METDRLDGHKRVLGILYLVSAGFTLLVLLLINTLLNLIFSFAFSDIDPDEQRVVELVMTLVQYIPLLVIVVYCIPSIIAGFGLLAKKSWATLMAMILGCFKLFSFPIGTAIGVYAIWIFAEEQKQSRTN